MSTVTTETGELVVTLSSAAASGYLVADALLLVEADEDILLSDNDAQFQTAWVEDPGAGYKGSQCYCPPGSFGSVAKWTFDVTPVPSNKRFYEVWVTWSPRDTATTSAQYVVLDGTTQESLPAAIDQTSSPADQSGPWNTEAWDGVEWCSLGLFEIDSDQVTVSLSTSPFGDVIADGVRIAEVSRVHNDNVAAFGDGWTTAAGGYDGDVHSHAPASTSSIATWTFGSLEQGALYDVYVTWPATTGTASQAQFRVHDDTTERLLAYVDQSINPGDAAFDGVNWHYLGRGEINSGILNVSLSTDEQYPVVADAVRIVEVGQIVDDEDMSFTIDDPPSDWEQQAASGYGSGYYSNNGDDDNQKAVWSFGSLDPGTTYRVLATWPGSTNGSTRISYDVFDGTNNYYIPVNQAAAPSGSAFDGVTWQELGVFVIDSTDLSVTLYTSPRLEFETATVALADAVRLVRVIPSVDQVDANVNSGWTVDETRGHDGSQHYLPATNASVSATWEFADLDPGGVYEVFVTWAEYVDATDKATFAIHDGFQVEGTRYVDQTAAPSGDTYDGVSWESLGIVGADSGRLTVTLSASPDGRVVADAVRLVKVGDTFTDNSGEFWYVPTPALQSDTPIRVAAWVSRGA